MQKILYTLLCLVFFQIAYAQETLKIDWPKDYEWQLLSNHEDEQLQILEFIPGNQTKEDWNILGQMMVFKGPTDISMDKASNLMYLQTKQNAPSAVMTELDRNESLAHPWILFKIECPAFNSDSNPESQVWHITRSQNALYATFVASKTDKLSPGFVDMWSTIFKNGQIIQE